jgi:hypothetical protein
MAEDKDVTLCRSNVSFYYTFLVILYEEDMSPSPLRIILRNFWVQNATQNYSLFSYLSQKVRI